MDELRIALEDMQKSTHQYGEEKERYFVNKYKEVSNNYPMLFKKACEDNFDYTKIFWMIEQKRNVDTAQISQHDASVKVGEVLVNDHIKPMLYV
jgi:hypothetical protein